MDICSVINIFNLVFLVHGKYACCIIRRVSSFE